MEMGQVAPKQQGPRLSALSLSSLCVGLVVADLATPPRCLVFIRDIRAIRGLNSCGGRS